MHYTLKVIVSTPSGQSGQFRELFCQSLEVDSALSFDYQKVIDAFYSLFPNRSIFISFTISNF